VAVEEVLQAVPDLQMLLLVDLGEEDLDTMLYQQELEMLEDIL
jgi:hypothetical protein